jgi:hypothetical protein
MLSLVQPRHSYAPASGRGHVYSPTSLWTVAARLMAAGAHDVEIIDLNVTPGVSPQGPSLGFNVVGSPYLAQVQDRCSAWARERPALVGGQVVAGLTDPQLRAIFGDTAVSGLDDGVLARWAGVSPGALPPAAAVSLVPVWEGLSDQRFRDYFAHTEASFFLSHGCRYRCSFCAAAKGRRELYRERPALQRDLLYLARRSRALGLEELTLYLCNLDLFQTPAGLRSFAACLAETRSEVPELRFSLRGLATPASFVHCASHHPELVDTLVRLGLHTVGFGVDGGTPEVWRSVGKHHNREDRNLQALELARRRFGLTPEVLMVFGHPADTRASLATAVAFAEDMHQHVRATPRPHVAKSLIPGSADWSTPEKQPVVRALLADPALFQALDFTALPSVLTHPDPEHRALVEEAFLALCAHEACTTLPVQALAPGMTAAERAEVRRANEGRYDH